MLIKNRSVSMVYKLIIVICGLCGLLLTTGVFDGRFDLGAFYYFTNLSNLAVMLFYIVLLIFTITHKGSELPTWLIKLKGLISMSITVTMIVAFFLLRGYFAGQGSSVAISLVLLHDVVPLMTIVDWIVFDKKGGIGKFDPFLWVLAPLVYLTFVLIVTFAFGWNYPYPFINVAELGTAQVAVNVVILVVAFIALGYLAFGADKLFTKLTNKENTK